MTPLERLRQNPRRLAVLVGAMGLALAVYVLVFFSLLAPRNAEPALSDYRGTRLDPPKPLAAFTLTNQDNQPYGLAELRGKPALVFFGYTSCPDICPTTLSEFSRVKHDLGAAATRVAFVFISVDGARDTPALLKHYLTSIDPDFIGLSGDDAAIQPIAKQFGVFYQRQEASGSRVGYLVDHTAASFLDDAQGQLHTVYSYGTRPEIIVEDVQALLAEQ